MVRWFAPESCSVFCNQQRLCRGLPLFSFIDIEIKWKTLQVGLFHLKSLVKTICKGIGELKYGENWGYLSFLCQGFISALRSFRNLLKSLPITLMLQILEHYQRSVNKDPVIKDRKLKEEYPNPVTVLTWWPNSKDKGDLNFPETGKNKRSVSILFRQENEIIGKVDWRFV